MADKKEILGYIRQLAENKIVSREEVLDAYDSGVKGVNVAENKRVTVVEMLYYIGGAIVFLGIVILIGQNWKTLSTTTKILTTLGSGISAYLVGLLFGQNKKMEAVGSAFYLISALVLPVGLYVLLDTSGYNAGSFTSQTIINLTLFVMYLLSHLLTKKNLFGFFSIVYGTLLFFSFTSLMVEGNLTGADWKFYQYRLLATGLSYTMLSFGFSKGERKSLTGFLNGFGIIFFLGSAMSLGGWKPEQNLFWEMFFPVLVFGTLISSVYMRSKSFLVWGTIFLMAFILKITGEYFATSMGWPLALVMAGFGVMGAGYLSLWLRKKYLTT